jgi:hypothetical protein
MKARARLAALVGGSGELAEELPSPMYPLGAK